MARVTGPMHSDAAQGTYGGQVTYCLRYGKQYVRRRVVPRDPNTQAQRAHRALVSAAGAFWRRLGEEEKALWRRAAEGTSATGYNLFLRRASANQWESKGIQITPTVAETAAPGAPAGFAVAAAEGGAVCAWAKVAGDDVYGVVVLIADEHITRATPKSTLAYVPGATRRTNVLLPAGDYRARCAAFNSAGKYGPLSGEVAFTVPAKG